VTSDGAVWGAGGIGAIGEGHYGLPINNNFIQKSIQKFRVFISLNHGLQILLLDTCFAFCIGPSG